MSPYRVTGAYATGKMHFTTQFTRADFPPETVALEGAEPGAGWLCAPFSVCSQSGAYEESEFDSFVEHLEAVDPKRLGWCVASFAHHEVTWMDFVFYNPDNVPVRNCVNDCLEIHKEDGALDWDLYKLYKEQYDAEEAARKAREVESKPEIIEKVA